MPHTIIPEGLQPRVAIPYLFFPLPVLMKKMGIISGIDDELEEAIQVLERVAKANAPDVPTKNNRAKQLATELVDTIPVVYGFRQYSSIAQRLKAQFNENSKIHSKYEVFPELNHNETVGYEAPELFTKKLSIILIRDPQEPPEIRNRIETTTKLVFSRANKVPRTDTTTGVTRSGRFQNRAHAVSVGCIELVLGIHPNDIGSRGHDLISTARANKYWAAESGITKDIDTTCYRAISHNFQSLIRIFRSDAYVSFVVDKYPATLHCVKGIRRGCYFLTRIQGNKSIWVVTVARPNANLQPNGIRPVRACPKIKLGCKVAIDNVKLVDVNRKCELIAIHRAVVKLEPKVVFAIGDVTIVN